MKQSANQSEGKGELTEFFDAQRPELRRAFSFGLVASLLVLAPTIYMFETYARVVDSRSHMTLASLTVMVLFALAVMEALEWARSEAMRQMGDRMESALMPRVYNAVFKMNLGRPGSGSTQPVSDLRTLRDFLPGPALAAIPEIPAALVFLVLIFLLSPVLGVVSLLGAIVQVGLAWGNERRTQPPLSQANRLAVTAQQQAEAMLRHAEVVRAMGMRSALHRRWMGLQQSMLNQQAIASDRAGLFQALTKLMQTTLSSALLGLAAWLVLENALWGGPGMMIVGSVLGGRVLAPLAQAIAQWRSVVNAREAWKRLDQLLKQVPEAEKGMPLPAPRGFVTVESLIAGAPGTQAQILRGIQFALKPGDALAVVGPSASGKTTLARLMVGVWSALAGKVRLDGADVFTWNKQELGPHVGYLPQGVELLDGTIAENIARFGAVSQTAVEEAAMAVGMHDWIMSLPEAYDTKLGMEGARLSGGQRQRIGLARALYGNPTFVVLDEPNSSLDEAGEQAMVRAIAAKRTLGTTFVLITHRTSALQVCSHMLVLRDGMQQAFGPRDDVLAALNKAAAEAAAARKQVVTA
jgi:ATP-binding cassette subfamily C exporter for protease/lipase